MEDVGAMKEIQNWSRFPPNSTRAKSLCGGCCWCCCWCCWCCWDAPARERRRGGSTATNRSKRTASNTASHFIARNWKIRRRRRRRRRRQCSMDDTFSCSLLIYDRLTSSKGFESSFCFFFTSRVLDSESTGLVPFSILFFLDFRVELRKMEDGPASMKDGDRYLFFLL